MDLTADDVFSQCTPEPNTGCWLWLGPLDTDNYARIRIFGRATLVGRLLLRLGRETNRTVLACHRCDTPACVNPAHLYAGSPKDNSRDASRRKRFPRQQQTHCRNGHPFDEANTYRHRTFRICRACNRAAVRRLKQRLSVGGAR